MPRLAAMILVRLASHGPDLVGEIVDAQAVPSLIKQLTAGTPATKQMAAQVLGAVAAVVTNRDDMVKSNAIFPLIALLSSLERGTPEAAARVLANLARADHDGEGATVAKGEPPSSGPYATRRSTPKPVGGAPKPVGSTTLRRWSCVVASLV